MTNARQNILQRLRQNPVIADETPTTASTHQDWNKQQRIDQLTKQMSAVRTEVVHLGNQQWHEWLNLELPKRGLKNILVGNNETGNSFLECADDALMVQSYTEEISRWKKSLFNDIDAAITTTRGAIAETGSLVLWPDIAEPRLMSLVPPVHIALLPADQIYNTFNDVIEQQHWTNAMPTNALLISGPSKTADIEQTLAYGIHGPRQLIVLIRDS